MPATNISRRDILIGSVSAGIGLSTAKLLGATNLRSTSDSYRFAHLTDLHIHGGSSWRFVRRALAQAMSQPQKPQMIVTGGDLVYDSGYSTEGRVARQWKNFHRVFDGGWGVPVEHILGNHDIWGLDMDKSGTTGAEPLYGKEWAMHELKLDRVYRSFDRGGWHFILLDDIQPKPEIKFYEAGLDPEQFAWLEADLKATDPRMPVIVVSHAPIMSSSVFYLPLAKYQDGWKVPGALLHVDSKQLTELFERHPNVKLCLSGHTHLVERLEYKGVTYLGNGAVCGNWWTGNFQGFEPGYAMIDLYPDGTFDSEYKAYGVA